MTDATAPATDGSAEGSAVAPGTSQPAVARPGPLHTPLFDRHVELGGQMVEFGGWMMPLQYSSMRAEHAAVRERVGIFDVSHMGEFRMRGVNALSTLQRIATNDADIAHGQARYTVVCDDQGGIVDDALMYRDADDDFMVVVNAGTRLKDLEHFRRVAGDACDVVDESLSTALLAVQGPKAIEVLQPLSEVDLESIPYYHHGNGNVAGVAARFSRTGYTGADGFELFVPWESARAVWDAILETGEPAGMLPCGLGARDTLRLEAGMRLSGQDITESTNPLESGLGWAVKLDKGDFVGREALQQVKADGPARAFIGLELEGRAIARHGYRIHDGDDVVGEVTSGSFSFTLGKGVAMGFVARGSRDSSDLAVDVRGTRVPAHRVPLPFYKRP